MSIKTSSSRPPLFKTLITADTWANGNGILIKSMDFTSTRIGASVVARSKLTKQSDRIERDPVAHHVITSTSQLV